jgi:hypothetical protein
MKNEELLQDSCSYFESPITADVDYGTMDFTPVTELIV